MLELEDKFYGSMAESKRYMSANAAESIKMTQDYYNTLTNASSELFMKIWNARSEYDKKVANVQMIGGAAGAVAGGGAMVLLPHLAGIALTGAGAAAGAVLWPVVGMLVGGLVIAKIAKNIASANSMPELEKKVQQSIEEFKLEVAKTKSEMTGEILGTVEAMFKRELDTADRTFLDFRMSVNIEGRNIPLLEDRIEKVYGYLQKIEELEGMCVAG